ncbi:MAG: hypothetical protein Q8P50_12610 [Bacillota bacterium]|nr:hypothetical protein [Bacillota bacterium]
MTLETMDPVLDGPRTLPQEGGDFIGTHAGTGKKHAVETMVITRLLGSLDFILDRNPHELRIRDF